LAIASYTPSLLCNVKSVLDINTKGEEGVATISLAALNVGKLFYFTWFRYDVEVQDSIFHLMITENKIHNRMWVR